MRDEKEPGAPSPVAKPALTPRAAAALAERKAREAEALRENLRKRKAQLAARSGPPPEKPGT